MTTGWRSAVCVETRLETPTARSIRLRVDDLDEVLPGQHVDIRLTADDGYQAVRSYSLSAGPDGGPFGRPLARDEVELTVEELEGGEVSPYLVEGLEPGDPVEIRGPIGGWFVWRPTDTRPVQLIGGGSGVAPLMAMIRARVAAGRGPEFRLLSSVRTPESVYYRADLDEFQSAGSLRLDTVYTREAPAGSPRPAGRLSAADLESSVLPPEAGAAFFVCGPNGFVAHVTDLLTALGHDPALVKTERFGGA
ncbi:FAD-binding oxidoreductase [Frondihabitans peucedani]|uniref:Ferredoxin reductase n=1 Tax=Frondihabitans peucedani TaxID=598626 RepID=A0ABP8E5E2_9MICO